MSGLLIPDAIGANLPGTGRALRYCDRNLSPEARSGLGIRTFQAGARLIADRTSSEGAAGTGGFSTRPGGTEGGGS
jgi:hypothetical protein